MEPETILSNLEFIGEVKAKRQTYYVYGGKKYYVSMTISKRTPNSIEEDSKRLDIK